MQSISLNKVLGTCLAVAMLGVSSSVLAADVEMGFSPEGSARDLVLRFAHDAKTSLDVMAYEWTARDITDALIDASRRGVKVRLVADFEENTTNDKFGASRRALSKLAAAGVEVRLNRHYALMHDKAMMADGENIQTGSFNYTQRAEMENSEQVLVMHGVPGTYQELHAHFLSRFDAGQRY